MADLFFGGGLNETDPFNISTDECQEGENFVLDARRRTFRPRSPQDLKDTATNGGSIKGIMQLIDRDDVSYTLVKADNVLYTWNGTSFTSKRTDHTTSSRYRGTEWLLDEWLIINDLDKNDALYKYDKTSVTRLKTTLAAGAPSSVTSINRSGSTATVFEGSHGHSVGDIVIIAGAGESEYNGEVEIASVLDANRYTYEVSGTPATPASGTITADDGVALKAKYSAVKDGRVWLFNITTDATEVPHGILASKFEDAENFDNAIRSKAQDSTSGATGSDPFLLLTPNTRPINGVARIFDDLIISTVCGCLFRLTGSDPTDYNFVDYYTGSAADGSETIINTGNDVMYKRFGGSIERLSDTERSGDVAADDASYFIPQTVDRLQSPIAVYDQDRQRACWFEDGFVLVYDKTSAVLAPQISPWSKHTTQMPNSFNTDAASYIRDPAGTKWTIYWGDSEGKIYDFNGTGFGGDAGAYSVIANRTSKYISDQELPTNVEMMDGRVTYNRTGSCTLVLTWAWGEEYNETTNSIALKGPDISGNPGFYGETDLYYNAAAGTEVYYNDGLVTGDSDLDAQISTVGFSAVGRSPGVSLKLEVDSNVNFLIDKVSV